VVVFAAYGRTLAFDWSYLDDSRLIIERAAFLTNSGNVGRVFQQAYFRSQDPGEFYYRPLVTLSYMADAGTPPLSPSPFHRTNLLLHLGSCCLLLALLLELGVAEALAAGLAAIFAVHPALTETVAWIPGRNDSLLSLMVLGSWLSYVRYRKAKTPLALSGHGLLFFLALLTKETAFALPALLIGRDVLVAQSRPRKAADRATWIVWGIAIAAWIALRSVVPAPAAQQSLLQRLVVALKHVPVLIVYLGKAIVPLELSVLAHPADSSYLPGALALVLVALALAKTRGAARRGALFGLGMFVLLLLPTLPVSDALILENRIYLPTIGLLLAAGACIQDLRIRPRILAGIGAAIGVIFAVRTYTYAANFRDRVAFGMACIRGSPRSSLAQLTAGTAFVAAGDSGRAEEAFRNSLQLEPTRATAHNNLAVLSMRRGELAQAEQELRQELEVNPSYDLAHYNLGMVLSDLGRKDEAATAWKRTLELNPDHLNAIGELWGYYMQSGDKDQAARYQRELARLGMTFSQNPTRSLP
jgi:tetratricopeptide (TPR) repeat protein